MTAAWAWLVWASGDGSLGVGSTMPKDTDNLACGSHCRTKTQHPGGSITGWLSSSQLQGETGRHADTQTYSCRNLGVWETGL